MYERKEQGQDPAIGRPQTFLMDTEPDVTEWLASFILRLTENHPPLVAAWARLPPTLALLVHET